MRETKQSRGKPDLKEKDEARRRLSIVGYLISSLFFLWLFQVLVLNPLVNRATEITYSDFQKKMVDHQIVDVTIGDSTIQGTMKNPKPNASPEAIPFNTIFIRNADPKLLDELQSANVSYRFERPPNPQGSILLSYILPLVFLSGFWYIAYRRGMGSTAAGGLGGIFGVGKSKAIEVKPEDVKVTYKDVGGADEAIAELQEIIQFLKEPERFATLGGRIPKGVLLVGPPGTGKTLLAKATAPEAQVAFFETSGSEFVEMFVGVGAARVRDLFEQARKSAPAIVFIAMPSWSAV